MTHGVLDIEWWRLALSVVVVAALVVVSRRLRLGLGKDLVVGSVRGSIQLLAIGYALTALFTVDRWELVLGTLLLMLAVAAWTTSARLPKYLPAIRLLAAGALAVGSSLSLVFMTEVVIGIDRWYDPQHVIPLGGMMLGNGMNAASVGGERFQVELRSRRDEIEAMLALGFTGREAVHSQLARSLRAAMIPTINSLMVAGLVQLPGMMTGQILSGVSPIIAVKYQVLIFMALMISTSVSTWLFLVLIRSRYVTPAHQFRRGLTVTTSRHEQ